MRLCGRCGHDNADHLKFCFTCGRRLAAGSPLPPPPPNRQTRTPAPTDPGGNPKATPAITSGYAATVALGSGQSPGPQARRGSGSANLVVRLSPEGAAVVTGPPPPRTISRAWNAVRYVFIYVRGRIDAEDRRHRLLGEREGAARLIDGALFDLGQTILAEEVPPPELAELIETVTTARARRNAAIADLAKGERLQASDDLRLGIEQSNAEGEWKTCEARAAELDTLLRGLDEDRRAFMDETRRLQSAHQVADIAARNLEIAVLQKKHALADEQYGALREKAAALRATTIAARAKFDQATFSRRQSATAMRATLSAHGRDRAEAEQQIRHFTIEVARTARTLSLSRANLLSGYEHVSRLEGTVAERDRQIAALQDAVGRYDPQKLALGGVLLVVIVAACAVGLWAFVH